MFTARMTKSRGILLTVVVLLAIGGVVWWTQQGGKKPASPTVTHGAGSAGAVVAPTATAAEPAAPAHATIEVKDADGTALGGATVRLSRAGGDVSTIVTGMNGIAKSDDLEPGTWTFSASAIAHEPGAAKPRELKAGEDVRIELTLTAGGRTLTGIVTDASGGPIAGARVDAAKLGAMVRPVDAVASAVTAADGKYSVTVADGQLLVAASEPSYAPQSRIVDVGATGAVANFALVPGGVVEGVVRDEATREPVAGAIVRAGRDTPAMMLGERASQRAVAGADGKFRIAGLRPGAYELSGSAGARISRAPTIVGLGVAEQVSDIEILISKTASVRGTVVDENGAPAAGVEVSLFGRDHGSGENATSDAKGAFVIEGVSAGRYMAVGRSDTYVSAGTTRVEVAADDVTGVTVNVKRGVSIVGHVEPRQQCEVRLDPAEDIGPMHMMTFTAPEQTTADGNFTIKPVDPDKYIASARCPSGAQGSKAVTAGTGETTVVIELKEGASVAGKVVDASGKPVGGVTVSANLAGDTETTTIVNGMITSGEQTLANGQGQFELRGLAPGTYTFQVLDRGKPLPLKSGESVKVAEKEKKTGVVLSVDRPDGVIRGVVVGPDDKPLADAWVSLHIGLDDLLDDAKADKDDKPRSRTVRIERTDDDNAPGGDVAPVLTDANGKFELTGLARVPMTILAEAQAGKLRGQQQGVKPDATITIKALGVSELAGTVKAGAPLTWFTVELEGPTREQRTFAAKDGAFSFGRVDPGTYKVSVTSNAGNGDATVTVEPAKPATVEISLAANAIVTGKLVDGAGKPVAGIPVVVVPAKPGGRLEVRIEGPPTMSAPDGTFRLEAKAGPSVFLAMSPPSPTKKDVQLEPGKTIDLGSVTVGVDGPPPSPPPP